jgi:arsenate reductase (glutaredoxin)
LVRCDRSIHPGSVCVGLFGATEPRSPDTDTQGYETHTKVYAAACAARPGPQVRSPAVAELTIYEKRTCTTCRKLAALLDERGIDFERIDFHVEPLTEPEIRELVRKTGEPARNLFRRSEPVFAELKLDERRPEDDEAIALMAEHPPLMQRPVVVRGERAVLARPVERVEALFG